MKKELNVVDLFCGSAKAPSPVDLFCGASAAKAALEVTKEQLDKMMEEEHRLAELAEQFKKKHNHRPANRTCATCKYGAECGDELCLDCLHPDAGERLVTSAEYVCDAWEAAT